MNPKLYVELWEAQGRACYICDKALDAPRPGPRAGGTHPKAATRDHVIPRARGGPAGLGNILLAHSLCNKSKGDRMPTEIELKRIDTTLAAMAPASVQSILQGALNTLAMSEKKAAAANAEVGNARTIIMTVLRHVPSSDAAKILGRLQGE